MNRQFFIAGVQFRPMEAKEAIKRLSVDTILKLELEPENNFDPNAIKIVTYKQNEGDEIFLGYVPKKFSAEVSACLENDIPLECIVTKVNPAAKPWEMCEVVVKDAEEDEDDKAPEYNEDEGDR